MGSLVRARTAARRFLATEASGGLLLLGATIVALVWANSPWRDAYDSLWHVELTLGSPPWGISQHLQHWINDALMTLFFFLIGLEIKRELVSGELREPRVAAVPALAALGGMIVPALLFLVVAGDGEARSGWAIAMATDIAFALGVLAVLGPRVPQGLKVFLLTLAIVDDIGAILVIALFYSGGIGISWLGAAAAGLLGVYAMKRLGVARPLAYLPIGAAVWYATFRAGVHPTIAGVALGLLTPAGDADESGVIDDLEHRLHPWSSYVVVPLFALANAGVSLGGDALAAAFRSRLTLAIVVGLVVGK
ncbi:MAG: Na+/H+ antiporter NhaA, partial [Actinomycetota bacterium]|nr:Na+/H+ antiporter NhaA [Actinomycetota bacterium]